LPCRTPEPPGRRSLNWRRRLMSRAQNPCQGRGRRNCHPHRRHCASPLRRRGLDWLPPAFASGRIWHHVKTTMINDPENRLIEALKNVDAHGDVAPPHIHDPMTMVLRGNAIQAHLMHWDDARGRYALTGAGRRRISARGRAPGTILSFRKRDVFGSGVQHRKPASGNLKE
jgi:hypothetical protein